MIKDVKKIKTAYRAVQFLGEQEEDMRELLRGTEAYSYVYDSMPHSAHISIPDSGKKSSWGTNDHYLNRYDWVVASSKGKVQILTDDEYKERFEDA